MSIAAHRDRLDVCLPFARPALNACPSAVRCCLGDLGDSSLFEPGDRIRLTTPGGGGYGEPGKRDRDAVREDVREGYVFEEAARRWYSLVPDWSRLRSSFPGQLRQSFRLSARRLTQLGSRVPRPAEMLLQI